MFKIQHLQINYQAQVLGLVESPQFSWKIISTTETNNIFQTAYQLQISPEPTFSTMLYDSGWLLTENSAHVEVPDLMAKLVSGKKYFVRVRSQLNVGVTHWSAAATFVTGKLVGDAWHGKFISGETIASKQTSGTHYLRGNLTITKPVAEAYVWASALGMYELYLNGEKVGCDHLTPGWTSYEHRLLYQTYDITDCLNLGTNVLGGLVGAGWYKGKMGFIGERNNYGAETALFAEVMVRYTDGTLAYFGTDESYVAHTAPVTFAEIYDGETYDATKAIPAWCQKDGDVTAFTPVHCVSYPLKQLVPQTGATVQVLARRPVQKIITTPLGETVLDFGQNIAGWVEFTTSGAKGQQVILECFEVLDSKGNVYQANLREAKQKITYLCNGEKKQVFHPHFTYQGFRYVKITAFPEAVTADKFSACVLYSAMEKTGSFTTTNPLINRLVENIDWSLKGNFVDIPTDCPQRNERVGWTGDAQIFCQTANYLRNAYTFYNKWLKDVACDQTAAGGVPHIVPDIVSGRERSDWLLSQGTHSAAAWGDVAVIAPWTLYQTYGDQQILRQQYTSMKKWIQFMEKNAQNYIWNYKLQFGDWVALDAAEGSYFGATPNDFTCTAYFAYSTRLFAKAAAVLGETNDATYFSDLATKIVANFQKTFLKANGELTIETQTAQIIALHFDLVPQAARSVIAEKLLTLLAANDGHLLTGFVGTPYFCFALSDSGHIEQAYDLLLKEDYPSWLYQVKKGATTIWEHWDGIKPDGSMWSPDMNSFNHYAYGSIGEWLYRRAAGIETNETYPGFKQFKIRPCFSPRLPQVTASYESIYGKIAVHWQKQEHDTYQMTVDIPINTRGEIILPTSASLLQQGFTPNGENNRYCSKTYPSGHYQWTVTALHQ